MRYFVIFEWIVLAVVVAMTLVGCCSNPYYCKRVTAIAIVRDAPIPCDENNCGKIANDNLAPVDIFFAEPIKDKKALDELQKIVDAVDKLHPGKQIMISEHPKILDEKGWERLPIRWRDKYIFIKRVMEAA